MSCVTREVTLPVGADEAWETVTELDEWLVEDADVELSPGAEGTLTLTDGSERSVVVADASLEGGPPFRTAATEEVRTIRSAPASSAARSTRNAPSRAGTMSSSGSRGCEVGNGDAT